MWNNVATFEFQKISEYECFVSDQKFENLRKCVTTIRKLRCWSEPESRHKYKKQKNSSVQQTPPPLPQGSIAYARAFARGHLLRAPKIESDIIHTGIGRVERSDKHMLLVRGVLVRGRFPIYYNSVPSRSIDAPVDTITGHAILRPLSLISSYARISKTIVRLYRALPLSRADK